MEDYLRCYVNPSVSVLGLLMTTASFLVLSNSAFKQSFFKYSKFETFFMGINLLITCFQPIKECESCSLAQSYLANFYYIYVIKYGRSICEMVVFWSNILAGLSYFFFLRNKNPCLYIKNRFARIHSHSLIVFFIFFISIFLFLYKIFEYSIEKAHNSTSYAIAKNKNYIYYELFAMLVRDGIGMVFLMALEILLLIRIKKLMKHKLMLFKFNMFKSNKVACSSYIPKDILINKAKTRMVLTVYLSCLKCLGCRFPIFLYFMLATFIDENDSRMKKFYYLSSLAVYVSYFLNFFLYYFFNKKFRMIADTHILWLIKKLKFC